MTTFNPNWDTSWTDTSIDESTITDTTGEVTDDPISNDNKAVTEISVTVEYGSIADEGVKVYVLRDVNGTDYEDVDTDFPWGFSMPFGIATTCHRIFSIPGNSMSSFLIHILNQSGDDVTASVKYKQATIDLA